MEEPPFAFAVKNYPLAPITYYKVGGPARVALLPATIEEAEAAHRWMLHQPERHLVLGGASNVLIADTGFPGIVLFTTNLKQIDLLGSDRYRFEAGVEMDTVVREIMVDHNYEGVGALAGIPASVGGAIYMNAGTVNGSTSQFLESIDVLRDGALVTLVADPAWFEYRTQQFCGPDDVIVRGTFRFRHADQDQQTIYDHYIQRRRERQPQGNCCGSVFRNPPGEHAGRLIEVCGLKGARRGGAIISPLHANFIMNDANASFEDVLGLIQLCKERVREQFGIDLHEEVKIIR